MGFGLPLSLAFPSGDLKVLGAFPPTRSSDDQQVGVSGASWRKKPRSSLWWNRSEPTGSPPCRGRDFCTGFKFNKDDTKPINCNSRRPALPCNLSAELPLPFQPSGLSAFLEGL